MVFRWYTGYVVARMKNTGITLPEDMIEEIETRREKGTSRSEYIRAAIRDRFDREDAAAIDAPADD